MNEKLEIIGRTVKKKGHSAVKIIKTETEKIVDEAVNILDAREKKKVWSGASSIVLKKAPDNIIPGCMVLEGGSFRGCYTSGVLDVFMENGINLQTTIGTSAGALNGYNYVAGEIGRSAKINLNYRHDPRYFSPKTAAQNHGVVGFNFIINEIESEVPFDAERFNDPSRRFLVTVTNCDTAEVVYCEKGKVNDIKKAVQASASMPFVSEMVDVDGMPCLDGGCAVKVPYKWALDNDFEKIIVIRTRTFGFRSVEVDRKMEELAARMYKNNPKLVNLLKYQEEEYNKACDEMEKLHEEGRIFMLCPSGSINISTIEGDMEKLGALYLLGRCDATIALPKVKEYLGIE
ncbi:MAG: patatin family protein [Clostridia bacterium]|nr:patatin family protein [Clostridia bacterium]